MENNTKMNLTSAKKYFPVAISAFFVLAGSILCFFALFKIKAISEFFSEVMLILQPIIFGIVFAYILNPVAAKIEGWLLKIPKSKKSMLITKQSTARAISVFLSLIFAFLIFFVLLNMVIPQLVTSITALVADMPQKIDDFLVWISQTLDSDSELSKLINDAITQLTGIMKNWVENNLFATMQTWIGYFLLKTMDVVSVFLNVIIGIIVSIYLIYSKEKFSAQFKKLFYAVLKPKKANVLLDVLRQSNKIFGGFISGKLIDSLIIGIICFVAMSVLRMPYTLLISVIVGVTNVIPFFGPFIGAIPSAFLLLLVSPLECLYFVILIIILQQLDGNVIGPKILGDSTGLSAFWVIFAILLSGGLFGFLGMLLGVPVFAVLYYLVTRIVNYSLSKNSMPTDTDNYVNLISMSDNGEVNYK